MGLGSGGKPHDRLSATGPPFKCGSAWTKLLQGMVYGWASHRDNWGPDANLSVARQGARLPSKPHHKP